MLITEPGDKLVSLVNTGQVVCECPSVSASPRRLTPVSRVDCGRVTVASWSVTGQGCLQRIRDTGQHKVTDGHITHGWLVTWLVANYPDICSSTLVILGRQLTTKLILIQKVNHVDLNQLY